MRAHPTTALAVILAAVLVSLPAVPARARASGQTPPPENTASDWSRLRDLRTHTGLIVETTGGRRHTGEFAGTTDDELALRVVKVDSRRFVFVVVKLARTEVRRVYLARERSGGEHVGVLPAAGLVVGSLVGRSTKAMGVGAAGGAGAMAVLIAVERGTRKGQLVYEAK